MKTLHPVLALALLAAASAPAAEAQERSAASATRIRVHHRSHAVRPFAGMLVGSTKDSLYLVPDGSGAPEPVALADIRRLQRSRGESSNLWRGALIGAIAGAAVGVGLGLAEPTLEEGAEESALIPTATGAIGALAGGAVGGLIGSLSRSERWEPMLWAASQASDTPMGRPGSGGSRLGVGIRLAAGRGRL